MKAPIVALAATAAGFAAASAYLYGELSVERVRTQAEVVARSKLEARSRQIHESIQLGDSQTQASVLPFSQIRESRFVPSPGEAPITKVDLRKSADPLEFDPREDRAPASRLARRLMRERNTLPEPASH